jgi:aldose 1-epimerase
MGFSISEVSEKGLNLVRLLNEKSGTEVDILPAFGAILHAFRIRTPESFFNVIDNYESLEQLKSQLNTSYKSSKLSPFPCRLKQARYSFAGKSYEFQNKFPDGSAIHGLLFDKAFSIAEKKAGDESASVKLYYDYKKDDKGYPYDYRCEVVYTLFADDTLQVETSVSNKSDIAIPIADGWHPYFTLGGNVNEWLMQFTISAMVESDENLIPTGRLLDYEQFRVPMTIGHTFLDNCFVVKYEQDLPACELFNPFNKLKISFYPDSGYPYLQIYTPPHRKSIAIENLSAAPDSFNNKIGLTILEPGNSQSFAVRYKLSLV